MLLYWKFDPILLTIGPLSIRWYGLLFVGAFFAGQVILARIFKAEDVPQKNAEQLLLYALIGTVVGARLVHCLFYDPQYYFSYPFAIFRVWEGGLASHGGAIGLLVGLWLGIRRVHPRLSFLWLVDRATIPAAFGAVLVRVANFLNSEIVGIPTSGGWGVVFESIDHSPRHPVQLYEAAAYLMVCLVLLGLYWRMGRRTPNGLLFGGFMLMVFMVRIATEFFKVPQAVYEAGQAFSVGQYLSLPFVILGAAMILWSMKRRS